MEWQLFDANVNGNELKLCLKGKENVSKTLSLKEFSIEHRPLTPTYKQFCFELVRINKSESVSPMFGQLNRPLGLSENRILFSAKSQQWKNLWIHSLEQAKLASSPKEGIFESPKSFDIPKTSTQTTNFKTDEEALNSISSVPSLVDRARAMSVADLISVPPESSKEESLPTTSLNRSSSVKNLKENQATSKTASSSSSKQSFGNKLKDLVSRKSSNSLKK